MQLVISDEQKLAAVIAYFEENESTYQIAKRLQIDRHYIRLWIELYRYHDIEGIIRPQGYTNYEDSFKIKVIQHLIETGDSLLQTAANLIFLLVKPFEDGKNNGCQRLERCSIK